MHTHIPKGCNVQRLAANEIYHLVILSHYARTIEASATCRYLFYMPALRIFQKHFCQGFHFILKAISRTLTKFINQVSVYALQLFLSPRQNLNCVQHSLLYIVSCPT